MSWRPDDYDEGFADLTRRGVDVHGEADFVASLAPRTVLDAGCGTGRVAIELDRRGIEVAGTDRDAGMLGAARAKAPAIEWVLADLATLRLDDASGAPRCFDVVVMAGNVVLFVDHGTEARVVSSAARHVAPGGALVAGFQLGQGRLSLADYDAHAGSAGLDLAERWSTWDRDPFVAPGDYAVSLHRRPER